MYLPRGDYNLLFFKVKFSLRNCDLFPGTALQCKETFSLLFYEFDAAIHQVRSHQDQSNHFASDLKFCGIFWLLNALSLPMHSYHRMITRYHYLSDNSFDHNIMI